MTRERAIQIMSNYDLNFHEVNEKLFDYGEVAEAFDMAIKALEQTEPEKCGDCISRQALQEWIKDKTFGDIVVASEHDFDCLPSVEPERKTGKWEYLQYDGNPKIGNWHCSECRLIVFLLHSQKQNEKPLYDFCPWCGAKMEV